MTGTRKKYFGSEHVAGQATAYVDENMKPEDE
jgi:hypothetical protein